MIRNGVSSHAAHGTISPDNFFDTDRVARAADTAMRKIMSKAGAFARAAVRSSIRM